MKSSNVTDASSGEPPSTGTGFPIRLGRTFLLTVVLLGFFAVGPALAQDGGAICNSEELVSMIEGFFQLTTGLGVMALPIVWQADYLLEIFTLSQDQQRAFQRHRRKALKSAVILVVLGPLYTTAGSMMGLPLADCVSLIPG